MHAEHPSLAHRVRLFFRAWKQAMDHLTAIQFEEPWRADPKQLPRHLRW